MGNNNSNSQENPQNKKGKRKGNNPNNQKSIPIPNIDNGNNKTNIINDNSNNDNDNEIQLYVVIETLIRIFIFEKKIKDLSNSKDKKNYDTQSLITPKELIDKYKNIFHFKSLITPFNNNKIILEKINKIL